MTIYQIEAWCKNLLNTIQYHILHWFNQLDVFLKSFLLLTVGALALWILYRAVKYIRSRADKAHEMPVKPRPKPKPEDGSDDFTRE